VKTWWQSLSPAQRRNLERFEQGLLQLLPRPGWGAPYIDMRRAELLKLRMGMSPADLGDMADGYWNAVAQESYEVRSKLTKP